MLRRDCPVPWATKTPERTSGTRISGFPETLKVRKDSARETLSRRKTTGMPTESSRRRETKGDSRATRIPQDQPLI
ncbi:hypothetical protein NDU88_002720 [Pleurodeles waltl]|uniref:Uncharacterized protein n=1 Tax=Pleurodeles waltl TaxID=8319 RepID=A0AAV7KWI7_PLEWA|nr:hypothetical protein NDU88_002720 [Pleurodeles waltl]